MSKKILLIDDEELIVKSLSMLLEKCGYHTYVSKTGKDAVIMFEEEDFDLIISDIRMPGMNGIEAVKEIIQIAKNKKKDKPPIIFITGYASKENEEEAMKLGPSEYIHKPFDIKELVSKVQKALK